ncbi:hypothetical protein ACTXIU_11470 [Glutamicibacter arilaitensis]|uniref:hypothetical protein n=1 Tax=Glutamicibacter arilaitensis TaxID=256701 RepID=UPI003FD5E196
MSAIVTCPNCGKKNRVPAAASGYPRCGVCKSAVLRIVERMMGVTVRRVRATNHLIGKRLARVVAEAVTA